MADLSQIPVRENGVSILASWFNTIRTFLINILGHYRSQENRSLLNGGVGVLLSADPGNSLDGLVYDLNNVSSVHITWEIERKYSSPNSYIKSNGELWLQERDGVWTLVGEGDFLGDDPGTTFDIDISGTSNEIATVKYDATNLSGSEIISLIKYDAKVFKK